MSSLELRRKGGHPVCKECGHNRTKSNDGVCTPCADRHKRFVDSFAVKVPVRFPLEPDVELPCEGRPHIFLTPTTTDYARAICRECPGNEWCFTFGMLNDEWGTWGGTSQKERRAYMAVVKPTLTKAGYVLVA